MGKRNEDTLDKTRNDSKHVLTLRINGGIYAMQGEAKNETCS
jgi:hypothetical protein